MGYVARVPASVAVLEENLEALYKNKSHIGSIKVNPTTSHLEIDLDWAANHLGGEEGKDFFLPIKRGKLREAKELADQLLANNQPPTRTEAQHLFDLIDPQNK